MSTPDRTDHPGRMSGADRRVQALAEQARYGDRQAFESLVTLFHEDIFRMIYYRTRSRMDAEDVAQEVFLQAYRNIEGLKEVGRFRSWLFSIAVNRVRDFHRKKRILTFLGISPGEEEPELDDAESDDRPNALQELLRQEFWTEVEKLADKFSSLEREVFFLRFLDQLSIKEISEALRKSESAIKTHLYRALKKFKDGSLFTHLSEERSGEYE